MVYQTILHARLVNIAWFWIAYFERVVRAVTILPCPQFVVKTINVVDEVPLIVLHINALAFAAQKLFPRGEQIFDRNDMFVGMSELRTSHTPEGTPPPAPLQQQLVPAVSKLKDAYVLWQRLLPHIDKAKRQSIAAKVDALMLEALDFTFRASFTRGAEKSDALNTAIAKLDAAKFFLLVGWECDMISEKHYAILCGPLVEASKMLVGWKAYLEKKTPANNGRK